MDDRLLTVKDVAGYLKLNDRTVLKLVTEGKLPGVKVGGQWRFRKAIIDTWLDDQMLGVRPRYVESGKTSGSSPMMLTLASCFQRDHIIPEMSSVTKNAAIEELAVHAHRLGLVRDKTWFVGALIERENIMPSATGAGTAFLHTVRRNPEQVSKPFMVLGRSHRGVDFGDSKPTHLFFVLGLKYEELYLPWLAKLSQMFAQAAAVQAVLDAPNAGAIYETLSQSERDIG